MKKPKSAETFYNASIDLYEQQEYQKALKELEKAEALSNTMPQIHYNKGLCYQQMGMIEEAKQAFQQALKIDPDDMDSLYNLSRLHYNEEDLDVAAAYAEQAESLAGYNGDELINYLLGLIYEQQGRFEEAIRSYEKSLAINPNQVLMGVFLGKLYVRLQEYTKAITLFREMVEQDPNNLEANYELSLCLAKTGEWEDTIKYCKKVIEIEPNYTKAYNQLGLAMYCTDRLSEAIESYEKALKIDPTYATALNNLAYTYEKMQNYDKAIEKFTEYLIFTHDRPDEKDEIESHIELLKRKQLE